MKKLEGTVLAIPDLHAPFHHPDSLDFIRDNIKKFKPDHIVCLGDEVDNAGLSYHEKDPNMPSLVEEYKNALKFMKQLYKVAPKVKVCISNHTSLPFRKAKTIGIPESMMKDYRAILEAPNGWDWKDGWIISNVKYVHGHGIPSKGEAAMRLNFGSIVFGHHHSNAGLDVRSNGEKQHFGMNVGCLVDENSPAFSYGKFSLRKAVCSIGYIENNTNALLISLSR